MKSARNSVTLTLMLSSMALLLILQFFWLKTSYRDAGEDFRQQTNLLFRNTIFAMHDDMIERSLEPVPFDADSVVRVRKGKYYFDDTLRVVGPLGDSAFNLRIAEKSARIEITTSTKQSRDSLGKLLRPIMRRLQSKGEPKTFVFRFTPDSLDTDSIKHHYAIALHRNGIDADFRIVPLNMTPLMRRDRTEDILLGSFSTDVVPFSPITQYAATFSGIESLLIKKISPQILFSIFLTSLTAISFFVMYRNMRSQQRLMQIKNDFISNITHELKTPVATVSVALEALKNFRALDNPQKTSEYLDIAQSELNRLTLMTDKILKTSVYEDQGLDMKSAPVDMDELLQKVLASMRLVFEKRRITSGYSKTGNNFTLMGSEAHLTNVVYNLIDNALKYSPDGSSLTLSLEDKGELLRFSIKDTGIGIPAEYHKKIFEKFFRVPSGDVHNTKGYGLGLSYVASVIHGHRGEIRVESAPGMGSNFVIDLPVVTTL